MAQRKERGLVIRAAYLRLAGSEHGLALNNKWTRKLTRFLRKMIKDGEVQLHRQSAGGRKNCTIATLTEKGKARLAEIDARYGPAFGPPSAIDCIETRLDAPRPVRASR